jgi:hypothetical protein
MAKLMYRDAGTLGGVGTDASGIGERAARDSSADNGRHMARDHREPESIT